MCGRQDKDKKIEEKIKILMSDTPDLIQRYMISIWQKKTASTKYVYLTYLKHFNDFIIRNNINMLSVKPMDIDLYIKEITEDKNGKENGFQIVNARLSAIISFYDFLIENQLIKNNPCSTSKKMKIEKKEEVIYLTPEEVKKIKLVVSKGINRQKKYIDRDLAIIELGCTTGLRVSAIANIDLDDIDFQNKTISVIEKGNKKRKVFFGTNTEEALKKWISTRNTIINNNNEKALFISKLHTRMSRDAISDMLKSATQAANINKKITPHKMRSTFGMNLYAATGDIYLTQNAMGHANIENTKIYVKATQKQMKDAANVVDVLY